MEKEFRTDIRPLRGTLYALLAAPLAFFGLFIVCHGELWNMLFVVVWCAACSGLLGWRAWVNLTGGEGMRTIGKPATGALLAIVAGGRLLMALFRAHFRLIEQQDWILWLLAALVLAGSIAVYRLLTKSVPVRADHPTGRAPDPFARWRA